MALKELDDGLVRKRLQEFGLDVGPITDSTREFYRSKLKKLLEAEVSSQRHANALSNQTKEKNVGNAKLSSHNSTKSVKKKGKNVNKKRSDSKIHVDSSLSRHMASRIGYPTKHTELKSWGKSTVVSEKSIQTSLNYSTFDDSDSILDSNVTKNVTDMMEDDIYPVSSTFSQNIGESFKSVSDYSPVNSSFYNASFKDNEYSKSIVNKNFINSYSPLNLRSEIFRNAMIKRMTNKNKYSYDSFSDSDTEFIGRKKCKENETFALLNICYKFIIIIKSVFYSPFWLLNYITKSFDINIHKLFKIANRQKLCTEKYNESVSARSSKYLSKRTPTDYGYSKLKPIFLCEQDDSSSDDYKSKYATKNPFRSSSHYMSKILLILLSIFFICIAIVYIKMKGGILKTTQTFNHSYPVCVGNDSCDCIPKTSLKIAVLLLVPLEKLLQKKAAYFYDCNYFNNQKMCPNVTITEAKEVLMKNWSPDISETNLNEILRHLSILLIHNPHWNVQPLHNCNQRASNWTDFRFFSIPNFSIYCLILSWAHNAGVILIEVCLACILLAVVIYSGQKYWHNRCVERKLFLNYVDRVLEILQLNAEDNPDQPYLAISHIRDSMLRPSERKAKASIWKKVVLFIRKHESRVREEVQYILGEKYSVWRWLKTSCSSPSARSAHGKVWQGRAFENTSLTSSLTPCLKIRNMFDAEIEYEPNWEITIQDAILEKCEGIPILHLAVDRYSKEGCVYAKLRSEQDAGAAFQALHGWYFDGNNISYCFCFYMYKIQEI